MYAFDDEENHCLHVSSLPYSWRAGGGRTGGLLAIRPVPSRPALRPKLVRAQSRGWQVRLFPPEKTAFKPGLEDRILRGAAAFVWSKLDSFGVDVKSHYTHNPRSW